jgi:DNA-directed RNA polymerase specialized sigma24 family protein
MDLFGMVCQSLWENDCARLKRVAVDRTPEPSIAPWIVAVVRNLTIDWKRKEGGRRRQVVPPHLSPLHQSIYRALVFEGLSHVEAYERIAPTQTAPFSFPVFLREVRETYRLAPPPSGDRSRPIFVGLDAEATESALDPSRGTAASSEPVSRALGSLPADVRLAVELFVIDRLPAAEVARAVGWPNAKTVYNKVYRALAALRETLEREGIGPDDLR